MRKNIFQVYLIKKFLKTFWQKPKLFFLTLLVGVVFLGGWIFFKYCWLELSKLQPPPSSLKINKVIFENVKKEWQKREEKFNKIEKKSYKNLFKTFEISSFEEKSSSETTSPPFQEKSSPQFE